MIPDLPELPVWLQDLNGLAGIISAIAALVAATRAGSAARDAGRAARDAGTTAAQVAPNGGGSSMRDSITRTEADVSVIRASLESLAKTTSSHGWRLGEIRRDLTQAVERHETDISRLDRAVERLDRPGDGIA